MINTISICIIKQGYLSTPCGAIACTPCLLPVVKILYYVGLYEMKYIFLVSNPCGFPKHMLGLILIQLQIFWSLPFVPIWLFWQLFLHKLGKGILVHSTIAHNGTSWDSMRLWLMNRQGLSWLIVTCGRPSFVSHSGILLWAKSSLGFVCFTVFACVNTLWTSTREATSHPATRISNAPWINDCHLGIFTAGVDGIMAVTYTLPSSWSNHIPAALWSVVVHCVRSMISSKESWNGVGDKYICANVSYLSRSHS